MPHTQHLSPGQQRAVEWLAQDKRVTCEECGSADLTCGDIAWPYLGHIGVELRCTNQAAHADSAGTVQSFQLSFNEAQAMGLNVR